MKGSHSQLTVTTTTDEATGSEVPLFAFPIQICKATSSQDVRLDRATPTGSKYDSVFRDQTTGEIYESADMIRGIRTGDSFATIPEDSIAAINEAVKMEDCRVLRSCDLSDVPVDRITGRYFIQAPEKGGSHKAYRLTYLALAEQPPKGKAKKPSGPAKALEVKFTSTTRQKLGVVYADTQRECLMLLTLEFAADLKEPDEAVLAPRLSEVDAKQVALTRKVIESLNGSEVDWDAPVDEAIAQKRELVEQAVAEGADFEAPSAPTPEVETVSADKLGEALEASLAAA